MGRQVDECLRGRDVKRLINWHLLIVEMGGGKSDFTDIRKQSTIKVIQVDCSK